MQTTSFPQYLKPPNIRDNLTVLSNCFCVASILSICIWDISPASVPSPFGEAGARPSRLPVAVGEDLLGIREAEGEAEAVLIWLSGSRAGAVAFNV